MKRMKTFLSGVAIIVLLFSQGFSQTYNMSNTTVITCSGTFYDSGGENNDYDKNEYFTMTFRPGTTGSVLKFTFTEFQLESHSQCKKDYLGIYDGLNASADPIGEGKYCGNNSPGTFMASNFFGAITFVFKSDDKNTNYPGWAASIECVVSGTSYTGIWTGNTSNDWSVSSNWDDGNVPGYLTDVTISATPIGGNFPEINSGNEGVCNDLTIASGGHLYIPSNNALTVFGTLLKNTNSSDLIVKSDVNGTGSLIHSTVGVNATIEQYLTSERWHLVSAPISNATINTYLDIFLKQWTEPDSSWLYLVEPITTPMNVTKGYAAWASDGLTGTSTVSFPGTMVTTDQPVNISYTNSATHQGKGFNLIGNPYPCSLNWNSNWNMFKMSGWMVVYNNGVYQGYHTSGTSYNGKTDGIIPPAQGFWVRATKSSSSLTIPGSERLHANQAFYKDTKEQTYPIVRLESTFNGFTDEAVVIFHPECTDGFDGFYDLEKFTNVMDAPHLSIISNDTIYAVNYLGENYKDKVIRVGFKTGQEGVYSLVASDISNFNNSIKIYLEDIKTKTVTELLESSSYNFDYHPLDEQYRFNLHFKESTFDIKKINESNFKIYAYGNQITVETKVHREGLVVVRNILGQRIMNEKLEKIGNTRLQLNADAGYYVVSVQTSENVYTKKVFIK